MRRDVLSCAIADLPQFFGWGRRNLAKYCLRFNGVTVSNVPTAAILAHDVAGMAGVRPDHQDRPADCHGVIDLARVNHSDYSIANRHHMDIRRTEAPTQMLQWLVRK